MGDTCYGKLCKRIEVTNDPWCDKYFVDHTATYHNHSCQCAYIYACIYMVIWTRQFLWFVELVVVQNNKYGSRWIPNKLCKGWEKTESQFGSPVHINPLFVKLFQKVQKIEINFACISRHSMLRRKFSRKKNIFMSRAKKTNFDAPTRLFMRHIFNNFYTGHIKYSFLTKTCVRDIECQCRRTIISNFIKNKICLCIFPNRFICT
jgi:hypothetical protein